MKREFPIQECLNSTPECIYTATDCMASIETARLRSLDNVDKDSEHFLVVCRAHPLLQARALREL